MKSPVLLGLLVLTAACSKAGPSNDELQKKVVSSIFAQEKNFKISSFDTEARDELKPDLLDQPGVMKIRYKTKITAEALKDCRYKKTSASEQRFQASSGFMGGFGGSSPLHQEIHICFTDADIEEKVALYKTELDAKLGQMDYSKCTNPMFCNGEKIDAALINSKLEAFRKRNQTEMAEWKVVKAGEKLEVPTHYVVFKGKKDQKEWNITAMGVAQK